MEKVILRWRSISIFLKLVVEISKIIQSNNSHDNILSKSGFFANPFEFSVPHVCVIGFPQLVEVIYLKLKIYLPFVHTAYFSFPFNLIENDFSIFLGFLLQIIFRGHEENILGNHFSSLSFKIIIIYYYQFIMIIFFHLTKSLIFHLREDRVKDWETTL